MALDNNIWPPAALERPAGVPRVLSHEQDTHGHRLLIEVTRDLCWFQGHFPNKPILAGVVQLHWAVLLSQRLFGLTAGPHEITRLKFQHLALPPIVMELSLQMTGKRLVQFRYTRQENEYSQGRLNFGETSRC
jgi:3-hydroxymyristoyl/3-hydroxydecanoyl-(acyl carrier protein) dehydratase